MSTTIDTTELDSALATLREQALSGEITLDQLRWYSNITREQRDALMEEEDEDDDEQEQAPIDILRPIASSLALAATDGTETIPNATDVFACIDSDFRNWGADEASGPTPETPVAVHEMVKDATFEQMFGSLSSETDRLCMTQSQIKRFCKDHRQHLRTDGYATFFLFKSKGKFFVADVHFDDGGRLEVGVGQFEGGYVWHADYRHRVVVPQL